ncbi:hypothetical protein TNCT_85661, partial [Trichonephila clavata]
MIKYTFILALCIFFLAALRFSRGVEFDDPSCDSGCPPGYLRNQFGICVSMRLCERLAINPQSANLKLEAEGEPCYVACERKCHPRKESCHHNRCLCRGYSLVPVADLDLEKKRLPRILLAKRNDSRIKDCSVTIYVVVSLYPLITQSAVDEDKFNLGFGCYFNHI